MSLSPIEQWFETKGYTPAAFQRKAWKSYVRGGNGIIVAPTGSGKTHALAGAVLGDTINRRVQPGGLRLLWITPLRALATDIATAIREMSDGIGLGWSIETRTGDTSASVKARQKKKLPEVLVTTPESLHLICSYPGATKLLEDLECVVVDEWHELLGTKRGVMMQLALAHLHGIAPSMRVWGMSATIGNVDDAMHVLLNAQDRRTTLIRDTRPKDLAITTLLPEQAERFPWAGHMGDRLLPEVLEVVGRSTSTLVFTNTRNQSEVWYRKMLAKQPSLAGRIALHHGSLSQAERAWVEEALHAGRLRAVIATSSLDLGVDFRPVDSVVQIGSPKGIARFMQRAGRSGHAPGETSRIYFVPTNVLELFEAGALKTAIKEHASEAIVSPVMSLDVLTQWMVTLGAGDGFSAEQLLQEVRRTYAFAGLSDDTWKWAIDFVTKGGAALRHYEHFRKLHLSDDGQYRAQSKEISGRHRLAIGAITSSTSLRVQVLRGQVLGSVEETFAGGLKPGQIFWFSGRALEFVRIRDMTVWVRASSSRTGVTPAWAGGRLPLSTQLAASMRREVAGTGQSRGRSKDNTSERAALAPLIKLQNSWSHVPDGAELLVEQYQNREGHHLLVFPFEGRAVHEVMAMVMALRLGKDPNTFSFAFNDYGFELLAAKQTDIDESRLRELLTPEHLNEDVNKAIESGSLARRQFRSIAAIAGLITTGRPGKPQSNRHLQASSEMVYDTLHEYDTGNLLLEQAKDEVLAQVVHIDRLRASLERIQASTLILTHPPHVAPLAFSLVVDRLRERLSTEKLEDRIERIRKELERHAGRA